MIYNKSIQMVQRPALSRSLVGGAKPDAHTRVCVLYGTEQMLMRLFFEALRDAIESEHGRFDTVRFDGQVATLADVFDELNSPSLLEPHKLVVLDGADSFVATHRQALERYANNPPDHVTLVLRSGRWNRGKLDKLIEKVGCVINCQPLPADRAAAWLIERSQRQYQRTLASTAAGMLVNRLGCDLMQLDNELAKLAVTVEADKVIQPEHVQQVVKRGGDEQAWVVQEVILASFAATASAGRNDAGTNSATRGGHVIEKIHDLIDRSGQPDVLVAYFVVDLIRKLFLGVKMLRQGSSQQQIAARFKLWGSRKGLFISVLKQLDEPVVNRLFDEVVRLDARAKTGRGSPIRNLECFCGGLTGPQ